MANMFSRKLAIRLIGECRKFYESGDMASARSAGAMAIQTLSADQEFYWQVREYLLKVRIRERSNPVYHPFEEAP